MEQPPTVFVVDDDPAMRRSLQWLVMAAGYAVEAFDSATAFKSSYNSDRRGCLVLDFRMPGMSGLELQEQLTAQKINIPVILISGQGDVATAVRAMKCGAVDFIEKPFEDGALLERIRHAISLDCRRREDHGRYAEIEERIKRLTPREHEVMKLVISGKANKQIATKLGRSEKTIEIHRSRVMKKMEAGSLAELVRMIDDHSRLKS